MRIIKNVRPMLALMLSTAVICHSTNAADEKREPPKRYRVIFNCDGHAVCKDAKGDLKQWVQNLFGPLQNSQVDALFWCDGSGGNTANYKSDVLEPTGKRSGKPRPWIKKLLDEGHDPPQVVVREAKQRGLDVFYSFRINDIHDAFTPDELATFKVEHPEWMIGERKYGEATSFRTPLNFALQEVRDLKFRVIEEMFQKHDFDGLEIDFLRSSPYFIPGEEDQHAHLLTRLLRRVREHLNQRGRQRGRPIRLAVRVDGSLASCRLDGFQVSRWIEQGLIDYLILGSGVIDIEVEEFKALAAPKGVLVYPCLYGWPSKYYPIPQELAAGLALNYWQQGADGIYVFNWFAHTHNNSEATSPHLARLLKQVGDPAILKAQRRRLMFAADRGRASRDNPYSRLHCVLPAALTEKPVKLSIRFSADFGKAAAAAAITLRLAIDNLQDDDVVGLTLNGKPVNGLRATGKGIATTGLKPDQLIVGRNQLTVKLTRRSSKSEKVRTVTAVEIDAVVAPDRNSARRQRSDRSPENSQRKVSVVLGAKAGHLDRYAASELCRYLDTLFDLKTQPTTTVQQADVTFLIGNPADNLAIPRALGTAGWPDLSDQGIVLKRGALDRKPVLVIGGGSPQATLWAVYELVERWGVRYLVDRDVLPARATWSGLPDLDLVMEPNLRTRCWRLVNDLADGPVSWSLAENRRFLRQIAKMKYNRIHVSLWPVQPFVHYEFRGMPKPPGVLYFGQKHPIDGDTIGREKFAGMKVFTNPELVGADSPEEVRSRGIRLVRGILKAARELGMETGLSVQPFEWPKEFMRVLPGSEAVNQLGGLTAGPGSGQSMDDPLLREMVATIVRAYIETYPEIDYIHVSTPEHRSWTGQAETAYRRLDQRYKLSDVGTYDQLCAAARGRPSFPGGGGRVETMLKGDLSSIWFFDSLLNDRKLLRRPGGGEDIKIVYNGVVAELFPLVSRMVPPGGEVLSFVDYTASRQLRQRKLLQKVPSRQTPACLIFTLADDNVGILPQLATGSLHTLMGDLRNNGWAGFYTRYWTVSDLDPTVHFLARASWDAELTPRKAYADQVEHICGRDAVQPALAAFAIIEQITLGLDQHGLGFGFPVPDMMRKHYRSGGLSTAIKQDQQLYRRALKHIRQARQHSRSEGLDYLDCFQGHLWFAVRYLDAADAFGATNAAEKANQPDEARRQIDAAYAAIREAIESYASVAKDHGDLGAVALMNAYCYRPIRDKRQELRP